MTDFSDSHFLRFRESRWVIVFPCKFFDEFQDFQLSFRKFQSFFTVGAFFRILWSCSHFLPFSFVFSTCQVSLSDFVCTVCLRGLSVRFVCQICLCAVVCRHFWSFVGISAGLRVCLSACRTACMPVFLYTSLSAYQSFCISACLDISRFIYLLCSECFADFWNRHFFKAGFSSF